MRPFPPILLALLALVSLPAARAQPSATTYRATERQINNLVHTRLDLQFDYQKCYAYGKEWLTLRPHAYPTDSLRLDAKGMDIKAVALVTANASQPLKYRYDQQNLRVNLGQKMPPGTDYTIYIEYTAKPNEANVKGSVAISEAKGLYFINPDSAVAGKPVQIWTQGETEGSSVWFPTIDRPNQKTTSEISLTVPAKYVTLSNGALVSQQPAGTGLRRDTWKMAQPHAPYLFMLAVGDFRIVKDSWRGKEVSYYMEPQFAPQARAIFGKTPQMLEFFSQRLGVEFPWNKYAQIVVRDYENGAMENTTASLFGEQAQGTARELLDWEYAGVEREIVHELFHQWFGDYVTTESWSNLTMNESFANFSEVLWAEHAYGPDAGAAQADRSLRSYLRTPADYEKPLVRFQYADKEDLFDAVSYQKGGSILNMLRATVGAEVFLQGLQRYLKQNAFGTGEAHQLRLALEEASGQDLNWFFNQWYYGAGHPVVSIDYQWDATRRRQAVIVRQTQTGELFILPLLVDVYTGDQVQRYPATLRQAVDTLYFPAATKPELVNVDAAKVLVWQKQDNKSLAEYAYQYGHAPHYLDRREALAAAQAKAADPVAQRILLAGLTDKSAILRQLASEAIDPKNGPQRKLAASLLTRLATTDSSVPVRAAALTALGKLEDRRYTKLFIRALTSQSYWVQGAALRALLPLQPQQALARATAFEADNKGALTEALVSVYGQVGGLAQWPSVLSKYDAADPNGRLTMLPSIAQLLGRLEDSTALIEGITRMKDLAVEFKAFGIDKPIIGALRQIQQQQATRPSATQAKTLVEDAVQAIQKAK